MILSVGSTAACGSADGEAAGEGEGEGEGPAEGEGEGPAEGKGEGEGPAEGEGEGPAEGEGEGPAEGEGEGEFDPGPLVSGREIELPVPRVLLGRLQVSWEEVADAVCPSEAPPVGRPEVSFVRAFSVDLRTAQQYVDLSLYASEQVTGVALREMVYTVHSNTVERALGRIEVWIGPSGEGPVDATALEGAAQLGRTDHLDEGQTTDGERAPLRPDWADVAGLQRVLPPYDFRALVNLHLRLDPADCWGAGGNLDASFELGLTYFWLVP